MKNTWVMNDSYRLILSHAEDISTMSIVKENPTADTGFRFVTSIEGWKPIPVAQIVNNTETRKQKDCVLCHADDKQHSLAWHAYGVKKDVDAAVAAGQDAKIVGITPQHVRRHFSNHVYNQPAPIKRLNDDEMLYITDGLNKRSLDIITAVYRQRVLSSKQIVQLFFEPSSKDYNSASKSAYRVLHRLKHEHCLFPFRTERRRSPEVYYTIGKHAVPHINREEGKLTGGDAAVTRRDQIKEYQLEHDITAADVFVNLFLQQHAQRDASRTNMIDGQTVVVEVPASEWYGERSLRMNMTMPTGENRAVVPDGFAVLRVYDDQREIDNTLPFFYEWDSGAKPIDDAAQQLFNYHTLSSSGAIGQRFPQFASATIGYTPPILMITSTKKRAAKLTELTKKLFNDAGIPETEIPTILVTDIDTLRTDAYTANAWHTVGAVNNEQGLVQSIHDANQHLNENGLMHSKSTIKVNVNAAKLSTPFQK